MQVSPSGGESVPLPATADAFRLRRPAAPGIGTGSSIGSDYTVISERPQESCTFFIMGIAGTYTPEKLVMCVLSSSPDRESDVRALLVEQWGGIDFSSDPIPFTATDYYEREMGPGIMRTFLSFRQLVDPVLPFPGEAADELPGGPLPGPGLAPGEPGPRPDGALAFFPCHHQGKRASHSAVGRDLCGDHPAVLKSGLPRARVDLSRFPDPRVPLRADQDTLALQGSAAVDKHGGPFRRSHRCEIPAAVPSGGAAVIVVMLISRNG